MTHHGEKSRGGHTARRRVHSVERRCASLVNVVSVPKEQGQLPSGFCATPRH